MFTESHTTHATQGIQQHHPRLRRSCAHIQIYSDAAMATSLFGTMKKAARNKESEETMAVPKVYAAESGAGPKAMLAGAGSAWTRSFNMMAPTVAAVR